MDDSFDVEVHPNHLQIKHPPGLVLAAATAGELWRRIAKFCSEYDRSKVLIEARSPVRELDTMSAFDSGRLLAENMPGVTIAVCLYDYKIDDLTSFFKTVAQNRGVRIEFFSERDKALRWLEVDTGENAAGGR